MESITYIARESCSCPRFLKAGRPAVILWLLSEYKHAAYKLRFVADWLNGLKKEDGKWDMGKSVNDKVYFPLSNDWRKQETREADCTERISSLLSVLSGIR